MTRSPADPDAIPLRRLSQDRAPSSHSRSRSDLRNSTDDLESADHLDYPAPAYRNRADDGEPSPLDREAHFDSPTIMRFSPLSLLRSSSGSGTGPSSTQLRLGAAFFLFGLLNNSLYVVILTAALELLPKGVPTGVVAFANIAPALVAKAVWPYLLKGRVRYAKRIWSCTGLSFAGMLVSSVHTVN